MKETREAQIVTRVWGIALRENCEMQRHRYFQRLRFCKLLVLPVICVCPMKLYY